MTTLGSSREHAAFAPQHLQREVEEIVAMQAISIRLPKSIIETFKALASLEGIGYQPLMREALRNFADREARRVVMEAAASKKRSKAEEQGDDKAA